MKLSDLQLSAYDLIGILLPGTIVLAQIGVCIYGPSDFWHRAMAVSTYGVVLLGLAAFGLGQLTNQAAHQAIAFAAHLAKWLGTPLKRFQTLTPKRVLKQARDAYWADASRRKLVCDMLNKACGSVVLEDRDDPHLCYKAYNLSLELIGSTFEKRAVFVLVAELALALWLLSLTAIVPLTMVFVSTIPNTMNKMLFHQHFHHYLLGLLACGICAWLAWQRTLMFEAFADSTVFDILLAVGALNPKQLTAKPKGDDAE